MTICLKCLSSIRTLPCLRPALVSVLRFWKKYFVIICFIALPAVEIDRAGSTGNSEASLNASCIYDGERVR